MPDTVTLDHAGLAINGQSCYLLAGVIHYFRYPQAEWRDLLLTAKAAGLNTIDTVIPWNLHEPAPGQYNFAAEADLAAYLDLCTEIGLYAIVRPGPYICAEWENGGIPAWLSATPDVRLRTDDPTYLDAARRWFNVLLPIITERQITKGGSVILCQIENEHWASGRYGSDQHQQTLADIALEHGIVVPQYTCMGGLRGWPEFRNGWNNIASKLQQTRAVWPDNPMIVSELWSGWFNSWGADHNGHKTPASLDRILSELVAIGASGFSHWVFAGGTNWGYWGGRTVGGDAIHMTTSYDYDAPIDEYGAPTAKYYVSRRHHLFCATLGSTLASVLADAANGGPTVIAPAAVPGRTSGGGVPFRKVRAATSDPAWADFSATFLANDGLDGQNYQVFHSQPSVHLQVHVEASAIKPIFANLPLGEHGLRLDFHTSRILGFWQQDERDVLVLHGFAGEMGLVQVSTAEPRTKKQETGDRGQGTGNSGQATVDRQQGDASDNRSLSLSKGTQHAARSTQPLRYWITERPTLMQVAGSERELLVVLLTTERAERWWPLDDGCFLCGPNLVRQVPSQAPQVSDDGITPFYELAIRGQGNKEPRKQEDAAYDRSPSLSKGTQHTARSRSLSLSKGTHPFTLSPSHPLTPSWQRHDVLERTATDGWQLIDVPRSLDQLGCDYGYGWYRAEIALDADTETTLLAPWLNDRALVLLDGVYQGWLGVHPHGSCAALPLVLGAGQHDLRLCVDNLGRFNYGSNTGEQKGLLDTLYLGGKQHDISQGWSALWQEATFAGEAIALARPAAVRPDATDVDLGNFAFQGANVWLLRPFTASADTRYVLQLTGDRNPGALFINGVNVERFSRHRGGGLIKHDISELVQAGENVIALHIQNYAGIAWNATLLEYQPTQALAAQWSFRAGVTPGAAQDEAQQGPAFHRGTFARASVSRLAPYGMSKGQIWLNERNVGRYWQVGPQEFYKLPSSWQGATNELLLFDEEGAEPGEAIFL